MAKNIMVEGLRPKFHTAPSLSLEPDRNAITTEDQAFEIMKFIPDWLDRGIVREITEHPTNLFSLGCLRHSKRMGKGDPF